MLTYALRFLDPLSLLSLSMSLSLLALLKLLLLQLLSVLLVPLSKELLLLLEHELQPSPLPCLSSSPSLLLLLLEDAAWCMKVADTSRGILPDGREAELPPPSVLSMLPLLDCPFLLELLLLLCLLCLLLLLLLPKPSPRLSY
jgi:hypothetical protein